MVCFLGRVCSRLVLWVMGTGPRHLEAPAAGLLAFGKRCRAPCRTLVGAGSTPVDQVVADWGAWNGAGRVARGRAARCRLRVGCVRSLWCRALTSILPRESPGTLHESCPKFSPCTSRAPLHQLCLITKGHAVGAQRVRPSLTHQEAAAWHAAAVRCRKVV